MSLPFLASICWLAPYFAHAQTPKIDSLTTALQSTHSEKERVDILNALSFEHFSYRPEDALSYASQALPIARKIKYNKGIAEAMTYQGVYNSITANIISAKRQYRRSLSITTKNNLKELTAYNYIQLGNANRHQGYYDSSKWYFKQALNILEKQKPGLYLSIAHKNIGHVYLALSRMDSALYFYEQSLRIREGLNNPHLVADALNAVGNVYLEQASYDKAEELFERAYESLKNKNDIQLEIQYNLNMGNLMFQRGRYTNAIEFYLKELEIVKDVNIIQNLAEAYMNIGRIYENQGYYERAMEYYVNALQITEEKGYKRQQAEAYNRSAWIYKTQSNFRLSEEYINKAIDLYHQMGNDLGLAASYNTLGLNYYLMRDYEKSLEFHQKALRIRQDFNSKRGLAASYFNIAIVYEAQRWYDLALENHMEGLRIDEEIGNMFGVGISCNGIASLLIKLGQHNRAEEYLKRAERIARETGSKEMMKNTYGFYAKLYEARKNFARALDYHKRFKELNDSLYSEQSNKAIAQLQSLFELEKKEREIQLLNQQNTISTNQIQLQNTQIRQQSFIIISALTGIALISVVAYTSYKYSRRLRRLNREISEQKEEIMAQSEELIEANQTIGQINKNLEATVEDRTSALKQAYKELDTFFYRSSHDFRRPLTTFLGLAEVAKIMVKDPNALELFDKVKDTAQNLDKMLVKLQSISDMGAQQLAYKEVFVKEIMENVCEGFREELDKKQISTSIYVNLTRPFYSYPAMIRIIVENLVENAIQFSGMENPFIRLEATEQGESVIITVRDNGQGINREYHDRIFDMYFRANQNAKGNGLGLYIIKKAVEKLNGAITFDTEIGKGSVFIITLPMEEKVVQ